MTTSDMTEVLGRSRASLSPIIRDILTQGRTVRSRNPDGEYAIVLAPNATVVRKGRNSVITGIDDLADDRADWTIVGPGFTFGNVAQAADPELCFYAPVFARDGNRVGTIAVNGSAAGMRTTTQGRLAYHMLPFALLHAGDRFTEQETDSQGRSVVFEATANADSSGFVTAKSDSGETVVFDLGPDYLAFKLC